jgi:hypothetical protein
VLEDHKENNEGEKEEEGNQEGRDGEDSSSAVGRRIHKDDFEVHHLHGGLLTSLQAERMREKMQPMMD